MLYDPKWQNTAAPNEAVPASRPTFPRKWWFKSDRLDARPVAWSLYNRPDDWKLSDSECRLIHTPSNHKFWVGNGLGSYRLYDANCSCFSRSNNGKFQIFQQVTFHRAFRHWNGAANAVDPEHFAGHFVA